MSIEREIKQVTKFRNEWHKASVNILYSSGWVLQQQKQHLDRGGLTPQQYNILRILKGSSTPLSTLQIRERMLDKMSDTSRIVDRLIAKELVSKCTNQGDKRLVDVSISPKGRELIDWMDKFTSELDTILDNLTKEEVTQLNFLLDKARDKKEADL
jgi:DNA-binding MarR family transcriptional regulator